MKVAFESAQFIVLDDFLETENAEQLWRWFQVAPFFS